MRYLSIILFTILCGCNDGGSDPEFVKSKRTDPTPEQQLHLDTTLGEYRFDTNKLAVAEWRIIGTSYSIIPTKKKRSTGSIRYLKRYPSLFVNSTMSSDSIYQCDSLQGSANVTISKIGTITVYDVYLSSPTKGLVAYLKPDSAWVIKDSAEALKMALYSLEQQAKFIRQYDIKYTPKK